MSGNMSLAEGDPLAGYEAALATADLAESTRDKYRRMVRAYLAWLDSSDPTDLGGDPLTERQAHIYAARSYRQHLETTRVRGHQRSASAVNTAISAVEHFGITRGLGSFASMVSRSREVKRAKVAERTAPSRLDDTEARRYLRTVETETNAATTANGVTSDQKLRAERDRVIALLPYHFGVRASEIVDLDIADVSVSARKGSITVRGKGDKVRTVPAGTQQARDLLIRWMHIRQDIGDPTCTVLVPSLDGCRLNSRTVHRVISKFGDAAGIAGLRPHKLRHTYASQLRDQGVPLEVIQRLLGHSRMDTTAIYTAPTEESLLEAASKVIVDE